MDNLAYIEQLYEAYCRDTTAVPPEWAAYFRSLPAVAGPAPVSPAEAPATGFLQSRVNGLLWAYRDVGYLYAKLNPLGGDYSPRHSYLREEVPGDYERLRAEDFGLPPDALDQEFHAGRAMSAEPMPLRQIIAAFNQTYCSAIGVEFLHIQNRHIRRWLIQRMESCRNTPRLEKELKRTFLEDLIRTEQFEHFLHTHFVGQRRFSLEGSEVLIPALHFLVNRGAHASHIDEIVIGTTHRGRLSILQAILNMAPEEVFSEFEEHYGPGVYHGSGDVKYHIGYDTEHLHQDGSRVHVSLVANPSHLESVNAVAEGKVRAIQDRIGDHNRERVLPVLLHGDAAFSGQGVVAETLNLSQLEGYRTGGTVHVIINNQIGFTTPSRHSRSGFFPTDIAKMLPIPVLHVNGDHPEAIVHAVDLALSFRQEFHQDVVVDLFCFRRHGHNEGDDPSFTHPRMYRIVEQHPGVAALYGKVCDAEGVMSTAEQDALRQQTDKRLRRALEACRTKSFCRIDSSQGPAWAAIGPEYSFDPVATAVPEARLRSLADALTTVPPGFHIHPKLARILSGKAEVFRDQGRLDWAMAEALAFGSLLLEGHPVRLSGQDSTRGTFSQRHLAWWDTESSQPKAYVPLDALAPDQARLQVHDSPLSEYSILGFEYGYSLVHPATLVIWEAQFGDFCNGAQVVIDNYIASAERKWGRRSGLVLLLPHGCEGQGPDHSSGHLSRFLQLCAEGNLQVCNLTTPAQYFHLLRHQVMCGYRKPLVLMTPKSLLRHPRAVSSVSALATGGFTRVLPDTTVEAAAARRVLLCSGKVYYDLLEHRAKAQPVGVAIVRLEQLYPLDVAGLRQALAPCAAARDVVWVQEEPRNLGAWGFLRERLAGEWPKLALRYVGRPESATSASGRATQHKREQEALVGEAFAP